MLRSCQVFARAMKFRNRSDLSLHDTDKNAHTIPTHIYENPFGQVNKPWMKAHFKMEETLPGILKNVDQWGVGRRVQFRNDVDPSLSFSKVDPKSRYNDVEIEYANDARTADMDVDSIRHKNFIEQTYWTITKVVPDYKSPDLSYGQVYGVLTINGHVLAHERYIPHASKPGWLLIPKTDEQPLKKQTPVVKKKAMYSPLPPLLNAQKVAEIRTEESNENQVPLMRNIAARNDTDCLVSITVLENSHDKTMNTYL